MGYVARAGRVACALVVLLLGITAPADAISRKTGTKTCAATATLIVAENPNRIALKVTSIGTTIDLGGSDVSSTIGYRVTAAAVHLYWQGRDAVGAMYCVASNQEIRYEEVVE